MHSTIGQARRRPSRAARYLLRFDDLCPTMCRARWDAIEDTLVRLGVMPIVSVVPDNRDPKLMVDDPAPNFWARVRAWQERGWAIALHGYQHKYVSREPGILRLNSRSEFAGLPYDEQLSKLSAGLAIFSREGVRADAFVAPAHSLDWVTVEALIALGIRVISDGFSFSPYRDRHGSIWIPQQFASIRSIPWGVWTFCYHHNQFSSSALVDWQRRVAQHHARFITMAEAVSMSDRRRSAADHLLGAFRRIVSHSRSLAAATGGPRAR